MLRSFNRMYRAHAGREDTVLFPELRGLVGGKAVGEVAALEQAFGVDDLAKLMG